MNRRKLLNATRTLAPALALAFALGACLTSCQRGRPARKELPEYLGTLPEIPATVTPFPSHVSARLTGNYLMYSTDTSLLLQGIRRDLLLLAFPDPSHDSTLEAMFAAGRPLVPYLLNQLRGQNKTGIVIDLRVDPAIAGTGNAAGSESVVRRDYLVSSDALGEHDFSVVFLWDRNAAARAAIYTQYLEQFPNISWSVSDGRPRYETDCFKDTHPTF